MFNGMTETERVNRIVDMGARLSMNEKDFFEKEIARWKKSAERKAQIMGERYYRGRHDILERERTVIGRGGELQTVKNLPNNKIVDNQYAKMVDQKTNYLLGKPFTVKTDNEQYEKALKLVFNKRFHRLFQNLGEDSINCGIGWLYVYYDEEGEFSFKRFAPYEILPFWKDAEHTRLDCVVRVYEDEHYDGQNLTVIERAEIYKDTGITRYILLNGALVEDIENPPSDYITVRSGGKKGGSGGAEGKNGSGGAVTGYNWEKIPVIPFKYNDEEIPLISKVKSLQDALNTTLSDFQNNMQEDSRNTILIVKNYAGTDLEEFRYNLAQYGAVKINTFIADKDTAAVTSVDGGVDALQIEVNSENYKVLLDILKRAIIENAMGYDAKDDRLGGNPNQMNLLSMYSDVDLDANGMETEYQASFEELLFFVSTHLANTGKGSFQDIDVDIVFNRDMLMNETDVINNVKNSLGILSKETLVAQHPWVEDVETEIKRLDKEKQEAIDEYADAFPKRGSNTVETDDPKYPHWS